MANAGKGPTVVPRAVVVGTVLVLLGLLVFDVTAGVPAVPWHIPGHTPSPITTTGLLGLIGSVLTYSRGPRPSTDDDGDDEDLIRAGDEGP